jgi:hypothetical protein
VRPRVLPEDVTSDWRHRPPRMLAGAASCLVLLTGAATAAAQSLKAVDRSLDKSASQAAKGQGSSRGPFHCPISTAQAQAGIPHGSALKPTQSANLGTCIFLTGDFNTDYLAGRSVRLDLTRQVGTVDNEYISTTRILSHGCGLQVGSDAYGSTLLQHCPAASSTVQDIAEFSFNSEDRKDTWIITVQYGTHVSHTEADLMTGLLHVLNAMR